jgi:signal transduction histidine kinase
MRQREQSNGLGVTERKRVEAVVETLANLHSQGESLAEVAHDARNMVTALGLYCDLLEEPGVLASPFLHYGNELRLVAAASRRLVEKLVSMEGNDSARNVSSEGGLRPGGRWPAAELLTAQPAYNPFERVRSEGAGRWDLLPATSIENLAVELLANRNLLSALAGPAIALTVQAERGALPVRLTGEDLTRVLVNLVKNAAEAMAGGGRIRISLRALSSGPDAAAGPAAPRLVLTIEDTGPGIGGPGIAATDLDRVFVPGYTTKGKDASGSGAWPASHRGLGLSITRSIVEAAGGRIQVSNNMPSGARFEIELPVLTR